MALIEFKNLPDTSTPLSAENLKNNFNELNNRGIYSTEEKIVGTWIDGKPMYRKVLSGTITSGTNVVDSTINSSVHRLVKVEGVTTYSDYTNQYSAPWYESSTNYINFSLNVSGFRIHAGTDFANRIYNLVIYYTKTTD